MKITDVLAVQDNDQLPNRLRCIAHALLIAMLALDRYGHTMSFSIGDSIESEVQRDRGLVARRALEDIRSLERREARRQTLDRIVDQRRRTRIERLSAIVCKRRNRPTIDGESPSMRIGKGAAGKFR